MRRAGQPSKYKIEFCDQIIEFCGEDGRSLVEFAAHIRVGKETMYGWARAHKEFSAAMNTARMLSEAWWADLLKKAASGRVPNHNASLIIFNMKSRFGWRDDYSEESVDNELEFADE